MGNTHKRIKDLTQPMKEKNKGEAQYENNKEKK